MLLRIPWPCWRRREATRITLLLWSDNHLGHWWKATLDMGGSSSAVSRNWIFHSSWNTDLGNYMEMSSWHKVPLKQNFQDQKKQETFSYTALSSTKYYFPLHTWLSVNGSHIHFERPHQGSTAQYVLGVNHLQFNKTKVISGTEDHRMAKKPALDLAATTRMPTECSPQGDFSASTSRSHPSKAKFFLIFLSIWVSLK